ncbi:MAG: branched-chain amino acid ABC transporter permease [Thermodesulfobacteriota bacterium]|nr:branched-chain amino acid ABC transporter permease [Thermodesulfobacteriota bacterium]
MALLPCGVYFETYRQKKTYLHTGPQWACLIGFIILLLFLPHLVSLRFTGIINMMSIILIAVVGLQITIGYTGQINLGQSAFMGMGAFVAASLANNLNWPFWITIPCGGLGGAFLGAIFALPVSRIKGFYLALTTLAAQIMFPLIIMHLPKKLFGGAFGMRLEPARFLGITLDSDRSLYYFDIIIASIMILFAFNLVRSRIGRAFMVIRDNDIAAEIIGINIFFYKTLAFFIGAFYAGVAGALWAYYIRYIGVDQFTLYFSIWYVGMLIVGGMGSVLGAILGTVFIRTLQESVTYLGPFLVQIFPQTGGPEIWFAGMNILLGAVIILFLIFEPRGLAHRWNIIKTSYRIWPFPYMK